MLSRNHGRSQRGILKVSCRQIAWILPIDLGCLPVTKRTHLLLLDWIVHFLLLGQASDVVIRFLGLGSRCLCIAQPLIVHVYLSKTTHWWQGIVLNLVAVVVGVVEWFHAGVVNVPSIWLLGGGWWRLSLSFLVFEAKNVVHDSWVWTLVAHVGSWNSWLVW